MKNLLTSRFPKIAAVVGISLLSAAVPVSAYILMPTKFRQPNVSAIRWKENFAHNEIFSAFISSKNDWDAFYKVGFVFNSQTYDVSGIELNTDNNLTGSVYPRENAPDSYYLNWYYLKNDSTNSRRGTAAHEWGHILSLEDTSGTAIMNVFRNRDAIYVPQTDDKNGVRAAYP